MNIPHTKTTLRNGLDVIIHEDHGCPIVGVSIWYHVGSKDERPGRTGFAHLFEHLMFEGSQHHDHGYFQPLQQVGAAVNGSTNSDRTNYWEVVPTNALELALWMESDRMGFLLPALTCEKFQNQREVVLNERRQNYENRPYGLSSLAILRGLYPSNHPYGWPTIGNPADLLAATVEDAHDFFTAHYRPDNASLALAGDVDPDRALALIGRYFEGIETRPKAPAPAWDGSLPDIAAERRLLLEDRVELPRLYLAWHSPALHDEGDAELDLLADLLANGKTSRLYRAMVYERQIAIEIGAAQVSRELSSFFQLVATAAPGRSLSEMEELISAEIQRISTDGVAPGELARAQAQAEAQFIHRLQTVGGFGGKSDQLNAYNVFMHDPGYFDRDLTRYTRATPAGLQAATARYLARDRRVALSIVPAGQNHLALPESAAAVVS